MIQFQNVTKIYRSSKEPVIALRDISFGINQGEFVSIVGKSGAGKTTLIKLLTGEEKTTEGDIYFKGINISKITPSVLQKLRRKIGVVYQDYRHLFARTVRGNLSYIMQVIGASDESIDRDVPKVLERVGLDDKAGHFPSELSGGEKQRLAIARALIHRPDVIVADEPTGNLDPYNTYEIIELLKKIHSFGTTVILSTHNKEIIEGLKRRVITLDQGRLVADDPEGKFIL